MLLCFLAACRPVSADIPSRVVLLAPFEGRYREIGYNALYSARLAIADSDPAQFELLVLDDGSTTNSALDRVAAIAQDPTIVAAIVLGIPATSAPVQAAWDIPVVMVGYWGELPQHENVFALIHPDIPAQLGSLPASTLQTSPLDESVQANDLYALAQVPALIDGFENLTIVSSGSLPDASFRERYLASGEFTPEPGLLATLTYDAVQLVIFSRENDVPLTSIRYDGVNGTFEFVDQFWQQAPIHTFRFQPDGTLQSG
jgi:hypothetical protein